MFSSNCLKDADVSYSNCSMLGITVGFSCGKGLSTPSLSEDPKV
jgi:hypothetical protein